MSKELKIINKIVVSTIAIFFLATISGSLLYLLYPHIHVLFPNFAENGILAKELAWWDSVCIIWIFSLLFKSSINQNN